MGEGRGDAVPWGWHYSRDDSRESEKERTPATSSDWAEAYTPSAEFLPPWPDPCAELSPEVVLLEACAAICDVGSVASVVVVCFSILPEPIMTWTPTEGTPLTTTKTTEVQGVSCCCKAKRGHGGTYGLGRVGTSRG